MSIHVHNQAVDAANAHRNTWQAMYRGATGQCPACGKGKLFKSYLKVVHECACCGTELHHQRADDAPPYFTMLIVAHIVGFGILALEKAYSPSQFVHLILWIPLTVILSLALLTPIKGALIGVQWAQRMHGFGTSPDPADLTDDGIPQSLADMLQGPTIKAPR